jgi:hypothetical protein
VAVGLVDLLGRLAQVVELAQLVGNLREHPTDGPPDRVLAVGDDARDGHRQLVGDLSQQARQGLLGPAQKAARKEHLSREALTHHPQHLVADVRLQPVQGEDHPSLPLQRLPQPVAVR